MTNIENELFLAFELLLPDDFDGDVLVIVRLPFLRVQALALSKVNKET